MAGTHRSSMQEGIPVKRNDATYVRLCGIERLHGEWLLLICVAATCVSSWSLRNPASAWGMTGFDVP